MWRALSDLNVFVGPPLWESFGEFYGFSPEESRRAVGYYRERYWDRGVHETSPYPGVCGMLRTLRAAGKTLALATSKPTVFAGMILEEYGVRGPALTWSWAASWTAAGERSSRS
jgi:phosphoglycolate phosphatase